MMWSRLLPVVVVLTFPLGAFAEDRPELSAATQEVLRLLSSYRVRVPNDAATEVRLIPRPLLTYGDAARSNESGTLWAWTNAAGRPLALIENYRPEGNNAAWVHALTLSSPSLIELDVVANRSWKPKNSHYEMLRCADDISAVADSAPQRLRQMKEISRRFQAHEFWDPNNSRFELRLLVQPVLRYSDAAAQIGDGAVFVFAHGTNPEVLL